MKTETIVKITDYRPVKSAHQYFVPIGNKNMAKKSPAENKKYHFIGIGGVGTSALAAVLMKEKAIITGSDMQEFRAYRAAFRKRGEGCDWTQC